MMFSATLKDVFWDGDNGIPIIQASILYKSIAGRYRPVRVADGRITARYRFIKNAYWDVSLRREAFRPKKVAT